MVEQGPIQFKRLSGNKKPSAPSQRGALVMGLQIHVSVPSTLAGASPTKALIQIILQSTGEWCKRQLRTETKITTEM